MAYNRLSMRKITETLRLHFEHGRTNREITLVIGTSPTTQWISETPSPGNLSKKQSGEFIVRVAAQINDWMSTCLPAYLLPTFVSLPCCTMTAK